MIEKDEQVFVEDPKDALYFGAGVVVLLMVIAAFTVFGKNPSDAALRAHPTTYLLGMGGIAAFIFLLIFVIVSFIKKRTYYLDAAGCRIESVNFWGRRGPDEKFDWPGVTRAELRIINAGKNQRDLVVFVHAVGRDFKLLRRLWYRAALFDEFLAVLNRRTPHLDSEIVRKSAAGDRPMIDEWLNYCRAARR